MSLTIAGPKIYTENGIANDAALIIKGGVIDAIGKPGNGQSVLQFPADYHLIPGFIDLHVHGAQGHDVMDAAPQALSVISKALAEEGTTSFLATTMTADVAQTEQAIVAVRDFINNASQHDGAAILGLHLEGPFLSPVKMGAQRGDKMLMPDVDIMRHWQKISGDHIRLVTLAPEQSESLVLIDYLKKQNIIASLGHTNATYAEAKAAIEAGCSYATHLFNAMRGIQQREPGTVTAALLSDEVMAELIVDGIHLHPAIVELALKVKGKDKIVLVTDAMRAKCLGDGCYELGGQKVHVKKDHAQLADGTLAGSVLKMSSAIRNMLKFTRCDLTDAVKMASENPAKVLGLFHKKGSIAVNKDADLVVLDRELNVVLTICGGLVKFKK